MARPSSRTREKAAEAAPSRGLGAFVRERKVSLGITLAVVLGVAALVAFDPPPPGIEFPSLGNTHLSSISDPHVPYNSSPPSSGPHVGLLARWGVSEEPIPEELFVHNLEDRGVILAYDCPDGCPDLVDGLASFTDRGNILVMPYSGIVDPDGTPHRGAAVAWTRVFYFDELDEHTLGEISTFINLFEGIDHHVRTN